jgi:hypothetical protein
METIQHFEAKPAFCRQRSRMKREDELYLFSEAELLAKLVENARRLKILQNFLQIRPSENAS